MDLTTKDVVVTDAIKYVHGQMDHLTRQRKDYYKTLRKSEGMRNKKISNTKKLPMGFFNLCFNRSGINLLS
jgi:hypothetical protein